MQKAIEDSVYCINIVAAAIATSFTPILGLLWPASPLLIHPVAQWLFSLLLAISCGLGVTAACIRGEDTIQWWFFIGSCSAVLLAGFIVFICSCLMLSQHHRMKHFGVLVAKRWSHVDLWLPIVQDRLSAKYIILVEEEEQNGQTLVAKLVAWLRKCHYTFKFKLFYWVTCTALYDTVKLGPVSTAPKNFQHSPLFFVIIGNGTKYECSFMVFASDDLTFLKQHQEINLFDGSHGSIVFGLNIVPYVCCGSADKLCQGAVKDLKYSFYANAALISKRIS